MPEQMSSVGWYPDPERPSGERYWDGEQWTEKRREARNGGLRPDIEAAKARMNVKFGGRRELRKLEDHLHHGESVEQITTGYYGGGGGLVVLTDQRLLFFREGWMSKSSEDFPMDKVSSVGFHAGLILGKISIHASGNKAEIENVDKQDGKRIVDNIRSRLAKPKTQVPAQGPPTASPASDPLEQLRKLGELRNAGVVTDEEFEAKKKQLLEGI